MLEAATKLSYYFIMRLHKKFGGNKRHAYKETVMWWPPYVGKDENFDMRLKDSLKVTWGNGDQTGDRGTCGVIITRAFGLLFFILSSEIYGRP